MDSIEKLALKRLGWSVAGLGMFGVTRAVRRRYGVGSGGRVPFPVALGVVGVSALVQHQVESANRTYLYEKGRADEAAAVADLDRSVSEAMREAKAEGDEVANPSNTRIINAAGKTTEQVIAEAKAVLGDSDWRVKSITPSKPKHPSNEGK